MTRSDLLDVADLSIKAHIRHRWRQRAPERWRCRSIEEFLRQAILVRAYDTHRWYYADGFCVLLESHNVVSCWPVQPHRAAKWYRLRLAQVPMTGPSSHVGRGLGQRSSERLTAAQKLDRFPAPGQ